MSQASFPWRRSFHTEITGAGGCKFRKGVFVAYIILLLDSLAFGSLASFFVSPSSFFHPCPSLPNLPMAKMSNFFSYTHSSSIVATSMKKRQQKTSKCIRLAMLASVTSLPRQTMTRDDKNHRPFLTLASFNSIAHSLHWLHSCSWIHQCPRNPRPIHYTPCLVHPHMCASHTYLGTEWLEWLWQPWYQMKNGFHEEITA